MPCALVIAAIKALTVTVMTSCVGILLFDWTIVMSISQMILVDKH